MRHSRDRRPDTFVAWKAGIFFLAAGLWIAGVAAGQDWLTLVAIGVLLVGILLRFLPGRGRDRSEPEEPGS